MHGKYLSGVLMILVNNSATSKLGYAHDTIGMIHTILLNRINSRIDFATRTVKIRSMHMDAKRLSANHFGMYSGRVSQPVMRMNDIKLLLTGYYSGNDREIINFFVQVPGITTSKLHTPQIIHMHIRKIGINMIAERVIFFRCHFQQAGLQVVVVDITPHDGYLIHTDYFQELFFFTARFRHTENRLHITLQTQSFSYSIRSNRKTTIYFGREFPSKH